MKYIRLTNSNRTIMVDDEFYPLLSCYNWQLHAKRYAFSSIDGHTIYMHRMILNTSLPHIDHVDGNGLNNQLSNLRGCTASQNQANTLTKRVKNSKSKYKGVTYSQRYILNWGAVITKDGKFYNIGRFKTELAAARAWDKKAKELYGEFTRLNFPKVTSIDIKKEA